MSPLATCLGDKMTPEMEDVEKLENLSDCLTSRSLVAIDAKWQIDNKVFSFGGREKVLKVWIGKRIEKPWLQIIIKLLILPHFRQCRAALHWG